VKVKVEVVTAHAMQVYGGSNGTAPFLRNLSTGWR